MTNEKRKPKVWFTSDTHFLHPSILYFYPKRRDAAGITLEELREDKNLALEKETEWLINLWNEKIHREDTVYIIGDFSLGNKVETEKILHRLHGKKYLIFGNHDKSCKGQNERFFEWCGDLKEVKFTNSQFDFIDPSETFCVELCHYPLLTWNRRPHGTCMIHGHCHNSITEYNKKSGELRVDVGLDSELGNYDFIDLETIYAYFCSIRDSAGCKTFQEYQELLMEKQGFRM